MKYLFAVKSIVAGFLLALLLTGCWFFDHECGRGDYQCNGNVIERCFTHDMAWMEFVDCEDYGAICTDGEMQVDFKTIPQICVLPEHRCENETTECIEDFDVVVKCGPTDSENVAQVMDIGKAIGQVQPTCIDSPGQDAVLVWETTTCSTPGVYCVDDTHYIACIDGFWNFIHDCDSDQLCVEEEAGQGLCRSTDTDSTTDTSVDTDSDTAVDTDTATDTGGN